MDPKQIADSLLSSEASSTKELAILDSHIREFLKNFHTRNKEDPSVVVFYFINT